MRHQARVSQHGADRLVGRAVLAAADEPRVDLLLAGGVPRELGAVWEDHLRPLAQALLDHLAQRRRLLLEALALEVIQDELEGRAHLPGGGGHD